jgi:hypothetical protein
VTGPAGGPTPPPRGLMAIGAAGLVFEAIVILLAVPEVITGNRGHVPVGGIVYLLLVALGLVVVAGVLRRPGGVMAGSLAQLAVIAGGVVTWPLYAIGVIFGGIWLYWLHLRRTTTTPRVR